MNATSAATLEQYEYEALVRAHPMSEGELNARGSKGWRLVAVEEQNPTIGFGGRRIIGGRRYIFMRVRSA